jgi:glycosyltransferase involved in cell wall biosynthesis
MEKIRVAIVHNIIPPYRDKLFRMLSRHPQIDLTVFFCSKTHKMRQWDVLDPSYRSEVLPGITVDLGWFANHFNPSIVGRIARGRYDVVVLGGHTDITMQLALLAGKLSGAPVILWTEGTVSAELGEARFLAPAYRLLFSRINGFIVPGTVSKGYVIHHGGAAERVVIAPNMVDNERFSSLLPSRCRIRQEITQELSLEGKRLILFSGRLVPYKGILDLVKAFAIVKKQVPEAALLIMGNGEQKDEVEQEVRGRGLTDVRLIGWPSQDAMPRYYIASDIFVLPTHMDVWGLAINEAMASALPIITTDRAGAAMDMVKDGVNGSIIPPGDPNHLARAIVSMLQNPELRDMGQRSLQMVSSRFSPESAVEGFITAILQAAEGA